MELTIKKVKSIGPCADGFAWYMKNPGRTVEKTIKTLLASDECEKYNWSNWLLTHLFTKEKNIKYAIFAAKEVLYLFEAKYPDDSRPKKAIEAAEKYLITEGADAAWAAAWAAGAAAGDAAWAASGDAARATGAAASGDAAWAAGDAAWAAGAAASGDAAWAAASAGLSIKIIKYGITLL
jgi:hypothetical protein